MAIRAPSELTTIAAQGKMSGSSPWIFGLGEATSKEAKEGKGVLPVGISQDLSALEIEYNCGLQFFELLHNL